MKCPLCGEWWNIHTNCCPNKHNCAELITEIERLKPFEDRNNKTLDHIKEWLKPIFGTEIAPMEEEDIRYIKGLLEEN